MTLTVIFSRRECFVWLILSLTISLLVGCSSDLKPIQGVVYIDGTPASHGEICFHPVEGGRGGSGIIQADGSYSISYLKVGDGLPNGKYKITLVIKKATDDDLRDEEYSGKRRTVSLIPLAYNDPKTTPLETELNDGGVFDVEVTTEN